MNSTRLSAPFLSTEETASRTGLSIPVIRRLITQDLFPRPVRSGPGRGRRWRFRLGDVERWVAEQQGQSSPNGVSPQHPTAAELLQACLEFLASRAQEPVASWASGLLAGEQAVGAVSVMGEKN
jgi:predicted DNA-binding transcriptional regulator AlpA